MLGAIALAIAPDLRPREVNMTVSGLREGVSVSGASVSPILF